MREDNFPVFTDVNSLIRGQVQRYYPKISKEKSGIPFIMCQVVIITPSDFKIGHSNIILVQEQILNRQQNKRKYK